MKRPSFSLLYKAIPNFWTMCIFFLKIEKERSKSVSKERKEFSLSQEEKKRKGDLSLFLRKRKKRTVSPSKERRREILFDLLMKKIEKQMYLTLKRAEDRPIYL